MVRDGLTWRILLPDRVKGEKTSVMPSSSKLLGCRCADISSKTTDTVQASVRIPEASRARKENPNN